MAAYIICQKKENKRNNAGNKCDATLLKTMSRTGTGQPTSFIWFLGLNFLISKDEERRKAAEGVSQFEYKR
jgi:hypothetical protein